METDRTLRISERFAPAAGTTPDASLCTTCVDILGVFGAGISIMSGRNSGPVCSSSERVRRLEDLQFSLGEGPCHDAHVSGDTVAEPDLADRTTGKWPNYAPPALELGACAVFAYPLHIGAGTVGVLTLYQSGVGMLTDEQDADALALSLMLPALMTAIQDRASGQVLAGELTDAEARRAEVHQASGVTAVQLGIDVHDALLRIRAHAYATNRMVAEVAQEILAHRLRLRDDGPRQQQAPA